jgi:hypothetical protein
MTKLELEPLSLKGLTGCGLLCSWSVIGEDGVRSSSRVLTR